MRILKSVRLSAVRPVRISLRSLQTDACGRIAKCQDVSNRTLPALQSLDS